MRKVDLGLDFLRFAASRPRSPARGLGLATSAEMRSDLLRFVVFKRTGVALFLGDSNFRKHIENRFALDFQLPRQVVDSNLAHPPFPSYRLSG
jgi:hypothetical protein